MAIVSFNKLIHGVTFRNQACY